MANAEAYLLSRLSTYLRDRRRLPGHVRADDPGRVQLIQKSRPPFKRASNRPGGVRK